MRDSKALRERGHTPTRGRSMLGVAGILAAAGLLAAACSGSPSVPGAKGGQATGKTGTVARTVAAAISITPANSTRDSKPGKGITVTVVNGKLSNVSVTTGGAPVSGTLSTSGTAWHTTWPLHPGARYRVTASAAGSDGKTATTTSSFQTLTPAATVTASTILGYHQVYGVGIPITINFSSPVTHKAAMERAVQITSSKPVVGAWLWDGDQSMSFRTRNYWPQHTKVSFTAHFDGMEAAPGVYATANLSQSFSIGNSLIGVTSTRTHRTRIYWKNKLYAVWPDSSGMPGDDTANGTYLTIEKGNPVLMSGPGYKNVPVYWSVRFTWSGNYYHSAPWSLGEQGFTNVSHGCVNLSPAHAQTYYNWAVPGDPITITGSPVAGKWDDGWTQWFWTFKQVLKNSATHLAVRVGPSGSTFVSPATLAPAPSPSVLNGSRPWNYLAK